MGVLYSFFPSSPGNGQIDIRLSPWVYFPYILRKGRQLAMTTIAALATPPGEGGIAIIRMSGSMSEAILAKIFRPLSGHLPLEDHRLTLGMLMRENTCVDECMAVVMRAPRSYTRETVVELQVHGGIYLARTVLALCLENGASLAAPGEFTRRAFLNGRLDLSQAESVMALIAARGEQARQAALRDLEGGASAFIQDLSSRLYDLQAGLAAALDYPEEISDEEALADLKPRMLSLAEDLDSACHEREARLIREGLYAALVGKPNVGKSSLLNALIGEEKAIVTSIPGTTRDLVEADLHLEGTVIHLTDTAGQRDTPDIVEQMGVERARRSMERADVILLVLDGSGDLTGDDRVLLQEIRDRDCLILLSKSDLPEHLTESALHELVPGIPVLRVSVRMPDTLKSLKEALLERARVTDTLTLSQPRHMDAARRAARHLRQAAEAMEISVDLASLETDAAQSALAEITGDSVEEKLLDRVFSTFCVGK